MNEINHPFGYTRLRSIHQTVENKPLIHKQKDIASLHTHPLPHKLKGSLGDGIDGVYNPRDVTKESQHQTDPKFRMTAKLEEDTKRWQEDGDDDVDEGCCTHTYQV